jgi:hypothetical protein
MILLIHFESGLGRAGRAIFAALILAICLPATARAQVAPAGDKGGVLVSAGAMGSGFKLQYGQRKMLGVTGFVDVDTRRRIGLEGEARFLEFHQTADVHAETYSGGVRYHFDVRRFQPYAKGLVGLGEFNFPYNLAHGSYFVVTGGGGLDFTFTRRITIRAADVEYQDWPQFTFGSMASVGASTGIRVRIF